MDKDSKYWKCEYENLRRKKNKQIAQMKTEQAQLITDLLDTFDYLGLERKDCITIYEFIRKNKRTH